MQGFGERLRARARSLDLTDSEIARRLGLSQGRYSNYVNEVVEPDLGTLVRILKVLGMSADEALGIASSPDPDESTILRERIALAIEAADPDLLRLAAKLFDAVARPGHRSRGESAKS